MSIVIEFYIGKKIRNKTVELLEEYIDRKYNKSIENGIYDYTKQYCTDNASAISLATAIYKDMRENILFNLWTNNPTIKKIKKNILNDKFNPYNLAFMRPHELNEGNWIKIIKLKKNTEDELNNLATVTWKPCFRCKGTQYLFHQLQTRSIDEPITSFYDCKKCGKSYSVNV